LSQATTNNPKRNTEPPDIQKRDNQKQQHHNAREQHKSV